MIFLNLPASTYNEKFCVQLYVSCMCYVIKRKCYVIKRSVSLLQGGLMQFGHDEVNALHKLASMLVS